MVNVVSRDKASSHPSPMGGIYVGIVKTVTADGRVFVLIPKLGNTIGPLRVANSNINSPLVADEQVLCAFTSMSNDEMYVLGYINARDVFTPNISFPSYNDTLIYDGTNWANIPAFRPTIATPSVGQMLQYNGTDWVNVATPPAGDWTAAQTVAAFTTGNLTSSSIGKLLYNTAACTLTLTGSTGFAVGQRVDLARLNAGTFTVAVSGATLVGTPAYTLRAQYSAASIICTASNTYLLVGDLG